LVSFSFLGNNRNTKGDIIDRKSYQWLGATVATGRNSDLVVVSSPKIIIFN